MSTITGEAALKAAMALKEQVVAAQGVGADVVPMLHLNYDGVLWAVLPLVGETNLAGDVEHSHVVAATAVALSPCDEVVVIADAYNTAPPEPGDERLVAQRFADGDAETVECLVGMVVRRDGTDDQWIANYTYRGRMVEWAEPVRGDGGARGPLVEALRAGFDRQGDTETLTPEQIAQRIGVSLVMPALPRRPDRNAPCPCGSGLKSKRCCWGPNKP